METNIKTNSWHSIFYKFWFRNELPNNLCNYVWAVIFAIITIPFTFIGRIAYGALEKYPNNTEFFVFGRLFFYFMASAFIVSGSAVFGIIAVEIIFNTTVAIIILGLFALVSILALTFSRINKSETFKITKQYILAKKNNYCPKINWIKK